MPSGIRVTSPLLRRLLDEHGLDESDIRGTGPGLRVTRADVLTAVAAKHNGARSNGGPPTPVVAEPRAPEPSREPSREPPGEPAPEPDPGATPVPQIEHHEGWQGLAPHGLCATDVDLERIGRLSRLHNGRRPDPPGPPDHVLPFLARAVVDSLARFPELNVASANGTTRDHEAVHLGVGVVVDGHGLTMSVLRDADSLRLRGIARELADFTARARAGELTDDDRRGATFTIVDPGQSGMLVSIPTIHRPSPAVLAIGGALRRTVVVAPRDGGEGIAFHSIATLGLTYDPRIADARAAAGFLAHVKHLLETKDWPAEL